VLCGQRIGPDAMTMPKPFPHLLVLGVMLLSMVAVHCSSRNTKVEPIPEKHKAAYEAKCQAYAKIMKPGMTRKDVEGYLKSKGITFYRTWFAERDAYADEILIGAEKPPFYCGSYNIYLAFEYISAEPPQPNGLHSCTDADVLKEIKVIDRLESCV
jgi:hypothetical protein